MVGSYAVLLLFILFFRCLRNDNGVERNFQDFSIYSTMDERNLAAYGLMTVEELSFVWRESCHCFSSVFFFLRGRGEWCDMNERQHFLL